MARTPFKNLNRFFSRINNKIIFLFDFVDFMVYVASWAKTLWIFGLIKMKMLRHDVNGNETYFLKFSFFSVHWIHSLLNRSLSILFSREQKKNAHFDLYFDFINQIQSNLHFYQLNLLNCYFFHRQSKINFFLSFFLVLGKFQIETDWKKRETNKIYNYAQFCKLRTH